MATTTLSIRLTPEQIVALKEAAGSRGASVFAREAVLAALRQERPPRRQGERDGVRKALADNHTALITLIDRVGLGRPFRPDEPGRSSLEAPELEALRREIQALVGVLLRIGRRVAESEAA